MRANRELDASVCRTEARNSTVGLDDEATSSTAVEANRPLKAALDAQTARVLGGAANFRREEAVILASGSGDSERALAAG